MSVNADGQPLRKSVVTMLPMINLSVTKMTLLHSLLYFAVEQSKNEQNRDLHKQYADSKQQRRKSELQHS